LRKEVAARTILTPRSEVSQHVPLSVPSIAGMELVHTSGSSINEFIAGHYLTMRGSVASNQALFNEDVQDLHPQAVQTGYVQTQQQTELSQRRSLHTAHLNTTCKCTAGVAALQRAPIEVFLQQGNVKITSSVQMCDSSSLATKINHLLHVYETCRIAVHRL